MTTFVAVLLLEWIAGLGILASTQSRLPKSMVLPVALLLGMFLHNVLFFGVDLIRFGLNETMLLATAVLGAVISNVWLPRVQSFYRWMFESPRFTLRMYDVLTLGFACSTAYYVVWAAWYWPVTPFDAMAGIDLVARHAVEEGTIANRVFSDVTLAGHLSNQPFYAPFAMLNQVMYRLMGFAYGQVWVSIVAILASWTFWAAMRNVVHPLIANVVWMLLILTPEMLGYTYLLQTDYLNAAYFCVAVTLLYLSADRKSATAWWPAAIMFAAACWSRTETVLLVGIGLVCCVAVWRAESWKGAMRSFLLATGLTSVGMFLLWNGLYIRTYLPVQPNVSRELIGFNAARFLQVAGGLFSNVIFDHGLWGAAFLVFAIVFVWNIVATRRVGSVLLLIWILAVLVGLILVGTVFSAAIVEQTLRRGVFKLIPLLYLWVAATPLLNNWSNRLTAWEKGR